MIGSFSCICSKYYPGRSYRGVELLLVDAVMMPQYFADSTQVGNLIVGVLDGATVKRFLNEPNISGAIDKIED